MSYEIRGGEMSGGGERDAESSSIRKQEVIELWVKSLFLISPPTLFPCLPLSWN